MKEGDKGQLSEAHRKRLIRRTQLRGEMEDMQPAEEDDTSIWIMSKRMEDIFMIQTPPQTLIERQERLEQLVVCIAEMGRKTNDRRK